MITSDTTTSPRASDRAYDTDLRGLLKLLYDYKISILLWMLLGVLAGLAYLIFAVPTYSATGTLIIDPRFRKIVGEEVVQGSIGVDQKLVQSQVAIIKSPAMLRRVVTKLKLHNSKEFSKPLSWFAKNILRRPAIKDPVARATADLAQIVKVKRPLKTYLVDIQASSKSADMAVEVVNSVIETYLASLVDAETEETRRAHEIITARLTELRKRVRRDEAKIDEYRKANKIVSALGGLVSEQQLAQHSTNLASTRTDLAAARARLEETRAALSAGGGYETLSESVNSRLIQSLREQHSRAAQRVASLSSQMLAGHPVLRDARSQQRQIRSQISAELRRIAATAQSDFNIAAKREKKLSALLGRAKEEVSRSNTAQIKLRELEQEWSTSRKLLRDFLARAKETQEQTRLSFPTARVISAPALPFKPSWPIPVIVLGLASIGGLGIGVTRALMRDHFIRDSGEHQSRESGHAASKLPHTDHDQASASQLSHSAKSSSLDPAPSTRVGIVSTIPDFKADEPVLREDTKQHHQSNCTGTTDHSYVVGVLSSPQTPAHNAYIDNIQALYARVSNTGNRARVLLLTAPLSGYGVSSIALSLTFMAIRDRKKVLLIDCAARSASLSEAFDDRNNHSHSAAPVELAQLRAAMQSDDEIGPWFLPMARFDLRTMSEKQTIQLNHAVHTLSGEYDLVIIDAGSVMDDEAPGPLRDIADEIYLVNRSGVLPDEVVRTAIRVVDPDGRKLSGLIDVQAET